MIVFMAIFGIGLALMLGSIGIFVRNEDLIIERIAVSCFLIGMTAFMIGCIGAFFAMALGL